MARLNHQATALKIAALGFSVLPIVAGAKRPPEGFGWKRYRIDPIPQSVVKNSFNGDYEVGVLTGATSGYLEVIDFDTMGRGSAPHFDEWVKLVKEYAPELGKKLCISKTPSGGRHVFYRCPHHTQGNTKLARAKTKVEGKDCLIETRGDGGLVLVPPSTNYEWLRGSFEEIKEITPEERSIALALARSLTEHVEHDCVRYERTTSEYNGERPGDKYNAQVDPRDLLEKHGWKQIGKSGQNELWRRPGKTENEPSATYHLVKNVFYNFSSNAEPLVNERGYSPFSLFVQLEHRGNVQQAAYAAAQMLGMIQAPRSAKVSVPTPTLKAEEIKSGFQFEDIEEFDYQAPKFGIFGNFLRSGQINLLDAPESIGKTKMVLKWAANMSKGWCDYYDVEIPQKKTLIFTTEDDGGDLHESFRECKGREGFLKIFRDPIDLRGDEVKRLEETIRANDFGLVVFDPLLSYMHGVKDINDARAVNEYLVPLRRVAMETGCCIINIRHFNKTVKDIPRARRAGGSVQFNSCHRSQVVIDWHTEKKGVRVCTHERASNRVKKVEEPFGWSINSSGLMEWIFDTDMLNQGRGE